MVGDLWPKDIEKTRVRPPVTILKEQASLLGQKTNNIVEGQVVSTGGKGEIIHTFNLVAPALDNYRYELFFIVHDIRMYPLTFNLEKEIYRDVMDPESLKEDPYFKRYDGPFDLTVDDEETFISVLVSIFAAKKTQQILSAMLAQSST